MEAVMLDINAQLRATRPEARSHTAPAAWPAASVSTPMFQETEAAPSRAPDDEEASIEWSEEDVVYLHWRLLQEVKGLSDPDTPLEDKLDTLRWVFTEREKDGQPFSFASCLRVVGCSPLSPIAYCGWTDPEEIRDHIRHRLKAWMNATLARYPEWVREEVRRNPGWVEQRLAKNPQWINEQIRQFGVQGDLFA
jgi:hypothetical protein